MFPIKDLNRPSTAPHINRLLITANFIIFLVFWLSAENIFLGSRFAIDMEEKFVMFPSNIVNGKNLYTLFTSMFMHAGWLHLLGNMLYLYIFGDNIEDVFGHVGYLIFYIVCGLTADFAHIISLRYTQGFDIGVVGASGAIAGVLGAYIVLYPKAKILTLIFYGWPIIVPIPALIFLGLWFLMQWFLGVFDITIMEDSSGVAYWAHVGGFVAGLVLASIFGLKRKKTKETRSRF
ncbi:MAG: rhomboid family intramembrane serine protease [Candidatus Bathyarchaeia archaeon]